MLLFDDCKLPDDERALEILNRISEIWEDNASIIGVCGTKHADPRIRHQSVSFELKEKLIKLSVISPQTLEDVLGEEASLHNILLFAEEAVD